MAAPITARLKDLFPDTVVVTAPASRDGFGKLTPGTATSLKARVSGKIRQVMVNGQMTTSSVRATFPGVYGLTTQHTYLLPSYFTPRSPKPIAVGKAPDENGPHHETVYFQ